MPGHRPSCHALLCHFLGQQLPNRQTPEWQPWKLSRQCCRAASRCTAPSPRHRASAAPHPRDPSATGTGSSRNRNKLQNLQVNMALGSQSKASLQPRAIGFQLLLPAQAICRASPRRAAIFNPHSTQQGQNFLCFPLMFQETKSAQEMPRTTEAPV